MQRAQWQRAHQAREISTCSCEAQLAWGESAAQSLLPGLQNSKTAVVRAEVCQEVELVLEQADLRRKSHVRCFA